MCLVFRVDGEIKTHLGENMNAFSHLEHGVVVQFSLLWLK